MLYYLLKESIRIYVSKGNIRYEDLDMSIEGIFLETGIYFATGYFCSFTLAAVLKD